MWSACNLGVGSPLPMKRASAVLRATALAVAVAVCNGHAVAQVPDAFKHSIFDPNAAPQDGAQQGASVASDGDFVVVGAPLDDLKGYDCGVVKVYHAATGALLHTLINPRPTQSDNFGKAVAISGSRVLVGAPFSDGPGEDRGRAYLYDLASSTPDVPIITFNNPEELGNDSDCFAFAVAIDGTTVVIGEIFGQTTWVYDLASVTPEVPRLKIPDPTPEVYDGFGGSVAVSGHTIAVGTWFVNPALEGEAVFVFDLDAVAPAARPAWCCAIRARHPTTALAKHSH